jgi:hypothetical protein
VGSSTCSFHVYLKWVSEDGLTLVRSKLATQLLGTKLARPDRISCCGPGEPSSLLLLRLYVSRGGEARIFITTQAARGPPPLECGPAASGTVVIHPAEYFRFPEARMPLPGAVPSGPPRGLTNPPLARGKNVIPLSPPISLSLFVFVSCTQYALFPFLHPIPPLSAAAFLVPLFPSAAHERASRNKGKGRKPSSAAFSSTWRASSL